MAKAWNLLFFLPLLAGCAAVSTISTATQLASVAMELAGLKKSPPPYLTEAQKPPRSVAIRVHASESLNAGADGKSVSLIVRLYKLKQPGSFQQAPYMTFLLPEREKSMLGSDLLEAKEVVLVPGQRYELIEKVSNEASHIGIVALFRSPSGPRWKATFAAAAAEASGIVVGVHGCSISIGAGSEPIDSWHRLKAASPNQCAQ